VSPSSSRSLILAHHSRSVHQGGAVLTGRARAAGPAALARTARRARAGAAGRGGLLARGLCTELPRCVRLALNSRSTRAPLALHWRSNWHPTGAQLTFNWPAATGPLVVRNRWGAEQRGQRDATAARVWLLDEPGWERLSSAVLQQHCGGLSRLLPVLGAVPALAHLSPLQVRCDPPTPAALSQLGLNAARRASCSGSASTSSVSGSSPRRGSTPAARRRTAAASTWCRWGDGASTLIRCSHQHCATSALRRPVATSALPRCAHGIAVARWSHQRWRAGCRPAPCGSGRRPSTPPRSTRRSGRRRRRTSPQTRRGTRCEGAILRFVLTAFSVIWTIFIGTESDSAERHYGPLVGGPGRRRASARARRRPTARAFGVGGRRHRGRRRHPARGFGVGAAAGGGGRSRLRGGQGTRAGAFGCHSARARLARNWRSNGAHLAAV
jgi:hypothetical protein